MGVMEGKPAASLLLPDRESWYRLAADVEAVMGVEVESFIEAGNRYIVRSANLGLVGQLFYLRLSFQRSSSGEAGELPWIRLDYLMLEPTLRRRGLGKRLVELIKNWAAGEGYRNLCLYSRPAAFPFWSHCGFTGVESRGRMTAAISPPTPNHPLDEG